jgi:hypothetical protein
MLWIRVGLNFEYKKTGTGDINIKKIEAQISETRMSRAASVGSAKVAERFKSMVVE